MDLQGFGAQLAAGTVVTLELAVTAMAAAIVLGLVFATAKTAGVRPLRALATAYTTAIRGLPELLIILLVYFAAARVLGGIAGWFGHEGYVELSPFAAGVAALGFAYGAYATEVFRGALLAVPPGQVEAAQALGMGRWVTFRRIVLPQLWRYALPALGNLFLTLLKDTALVSVIGVEDLMRETSIAVGYTKEPFTFYFAAALIYLGLTVVCVIGIYGLERLAGRGYQQSEAP